MSHKNVKNILSTIASTLVATTLLTTSFNTSADTRGIFLLDKTGSMNVSRTAPDAWQYPTRCDFAKHRIITNINSFRLRHNGDFIDVRHFSGAGTLTSLTGGFVDVGSMSNSQFGGFLQNLSQQVDALSCSGNTAIGDAICESAPDLRALFSSGDNLMLGILTDAAENASQNCGGPNYVDNYIRPLILANPEIRFKVEVLTTPGGNTFRAATTKSLATEDADVMRSAMSVTQTSEIDQLKSLATDSGGDFSVVSDDGSCTGECDGIIDDDW